MTVRTTNHEWLGLTIEEPLEPELPICDPHHHLWDRVSGRVAPRYLLDEILEDVLGGGHNVVSTVFIECGAMWKPDGPEAMRYIGETEFVNGIAAMSASGLYGKTRVAAGIVGTAPLRLGKAVGDVLDAQIAAGGGRFRGIRLGAAWDADAAVPKHRTGPPQGLFLRDDFRAGFAELAPRQLTFEAWCYHPQIPDVTALARAFPKTTIILEPLRRADRHRILCRPDPRGLCRVAALRRRARHLPERRGQARRDQHGGERLRLARAAQAAIEPGADGGDAPATTTSPSRSLAPTGACSSRTSPWTR